MRGERGSVLIHVLVTMILLAIISVSVIRLRLQPATIAAASVARVGEDLSARAALSRLNESWIRLGSCASDGAAGIACVGAGCACRCVVGTVVVTAVPSGGACALSVAP